MYSLQHLLSQVPVLFDWLLWSHNVSFHLMCPCCVVHFSTFLFTDLCFLIHQKSLLNGSKKTVYWRAPSLEAHPTETVTHKAYLKKHVVIMDFCLVMYALNFFLIHRWFRHYTTMVLMQYGSTLCWTRHPSWAGNAKPILRIKSSEYFVLKHFLT